MDRKKPPALTSPWKVGFLVALMMVVTGLGVGYFISGTFGLKWQWIEFGGASPSEWTFRLGAFIDEMVPLLALVTLLAVASYVLVAGAVRRYTRFVNSGIDFKQLLKSIKTLDDLEDEERLEQLKQHPELREFLLGFKNRMAARERHNEREKRPAPAREADTHARNLPAESGLLVSAIMNGKSGFSHELALTIPELKQIERAAREQLTRDVPDAGELETLRHRVDATLNAVRTQCAGIRRDTDACADGAREMEKLLAQLARAIDAEQEPAAATEGIAAATKQLDAMAETLAGLGEETRRIAIAAALEASGAAGEGKSIQVADEVRTIATRFNAVAAQWKQTGPALRASVATLEKGVSVADRRRATLSGSADKTAAVARKWNERLVALQEQVRGLERAIDGQGDSGPAREWGAIDTNFGDDSAGVEFERSIPREDRAPEVQDAAPVEVPVAEPDDEFQNAAKDHVFEESDGDDVQFADIPGFEKEQRVFNEGLARAHGAGEGPDGIEVEQNAGDDHHIAAAAQPAVAPVHDAPAAPEATTGDDGFLTGPRASENAAAPEAEPAPARRRQRKAVPAPAPAGPAEDGRFDIDVDADGDADAHDLYTIGAVDYVEGVHA